MSEITPWEIDQLKARWIVYNQYAPDVLMLCQEILRLQKERSILLDTNLRLEGEIKELRLLKDKRGQKNRRTNNSKSGLSS